MSNETLEERFLRFLRENHSLSNSAANNVLSQVKVPLKGEDGFANFYEMAKLQVSLDGALDNVVNNIFEEGPTSDYLIDFFKFSSNDFEEETPTDSGLETKVNGSARLSLAGESQAGYERPPVAVTVEDTSEPTNLISGMFEPPADSIDHKALLAGGEDSELPITQTRDFAMGDEPIEHRKSTRWPYGVALLGAAALALFAGREQLGDLGSSTFDYLIGKPFAGLMASSALPDLGALALLDTDEPEPELDINDGVNYPTLSSIVEEEIIDTIIPDVKEDGYISFDGNAITFTPTEGSSIFELAAMINQFAYADSQNMSIDVYTFASMSEEGLDNLRLGLRGQSFTRESLLANLELTKLIIEQNPDLVHNIDLTAEGLRDGTKNVIYTNVPLSVNLIPDSYADDNNTLLVQGRIIDDIESVAYSATANVSLEQSLTAFRDLEALVQENPTLLAKRNLDANDARTNLAQEVARQYNSNDGLDNVDVSQWAYDKRISLALEWYKTCANPGDRETYMTVDEIVKSANLNLADEEKAITAKDIRNSTDFRRSGLGTLAALNGQRSSARQERKTKVYNTFVEQGLTDLGSEEAKQFVGEQAEELGYTERTVKQYIKEASQEVPEPRLTYDDVVLGGGNRTFLYCGDKPEEDSIEEIVIEPDKSVMEDSLEEITSVDRDQIIEDVAKVLGNSQDVPEPSLTYDDVVLGGGNRTFLYAGDKPVEVSEEEPLRVDIGNTVEKIILNDLAITYDPLVNDTPLEDFSYPDLSKSLMDYKSLATTCLDDACVDIDDFEINLVGGPEGIRQLIAVNIAKSLTEKKGTGINLDSGVYDSFEWTYDTRMNLAVDLVTHANGYNGGSSTVGEFDESSYLEINEIVNFVNDLREDRREKPITKKDLNQYLESQNISRSDLDLSYLM
ncbi:hypothetical protein HN681_03295 [archaeon]|jgi:hypothetical protein|nr:hypothetical protein [archaeon]MBT3730891.1 hypothetical protein [archaeon]MBT4669870.1 hypothetical protein [archaeon]MBT5030022.1 hypothetical protein [archaeon]MBT5288123.1 hypothetical protein [archaeon]